jgi:hypothetical protein
VTLVGQPAVLSREAFAAWLPAQAAHEPQACVTLQLEATGSWCSPRTPRSKAPRSSAPATRRLWGGRGLVLVGALGDAWDDRDNGPGPDGLGELPLPLS